jgi:DNA-directed RNA polymerase subunit RPC12/RpoP
VNNLAENKNTPFSRNPELASVLMIEQASRENNYSLIEQVIDEESTRFAEIIDGPIRTQFNFERTDAGLVSKAGARLLDLWKNSYELTKFKSNFDYRQKKLLEFRAAEYSEGESVEKLAEYGNEGDGFLVVSPYPEELEHLYGKEFVQKEGFNSRRKLAFIRQYQKVGESIELTTASVDNSNLAIWEEVLGSPIKDTNDLLLKRFSLGSSSIDSLISNYDSLLLRQTGITHSQGRSAVAGIDTYLFVNNQKDLLEYNLNKLKIIASANTSLAKKLNERINLTKQIASALIYRYEHQNTMQSGSLEAEIKSASAKASSEGLEFISCGGYISASEESLLKTVTRTNDSMKCVTCPFCKKTVDAIVKKSTIACPECRVEVNTRTNKIRSNKQKTSFTKIVEKILEDLFATAKN